MRHEQRERSLREGGLYTGAAVNEVRAGLEATYAALKKTKQDEFEALTRSSTAEIERARATVQKLRGEIATAAINADASSQQADFIRKLREQCEEMAGECAKRRSNEQTPQQIMTEARLQEAG